MNLTFEPESHTYRLEGKVIPSVTQILTSEGFIDGSWFTEYSRDRGTKVHRAIELYDDGDLDEERLDPVLRPYLEAWKRFKAHASVSVLRSEIQLASEAYQFAGTVDKTALLGGMKAVLDIKTGEVQPWTGLQLAAYQLLLAETMPRIAVQLKADGNYMLHEFKDRADRNVFLAALTVHQWKRRANGN